MRNDVGNEADLELLKTCTRRLSSGPSRVETVMIQNTDHMYAGEEAQVAEVIARWADALVPRNQEMAILKTNGSGTSVAGRRTRSRATGFVGTERRVSAGFRPQIAAHCHPVIAVMVLLGFVGL
jgi:hypothetical protein